MLGSGLGWRNGTACTWVNGVDRHRYPASWVCIFEFLNYKARAFVRLNYESDGSMDSPKTVPGREW